MLAPESSQGLLLIVSSYLQATRVRALQTAYRKAEAAHPREDVPKAGEIRNLGLLNKGDDTKAVLGK
jgi:NADH dehydrogenase (ubiquinone) Fe-S protein 5